MSESSFSAIYALHSRTVEETAARILGNRAQAADVAQTVFLKFWQRPQMFRGGNLEGWLVRIARNCAIDELRKRRETISSEIVETAAAEEAVESRVLRGLQRRAVLAAVERLPRQQRDALTLAFLHGLTNSDIAKRTALPLGTVKTRIRTALRALRKHVEAA